MNNTLPLPPSEHATPPTSSSYTASIVLMWVYVLWIALLMAFAYVGMWFIEQVAELEGEPLGFGWLSFSLVQGSLLILSLFPLARFWKPARYQAIFNTWLVGALFVLLMSPLRVVPLMDALQAATVQVGLVALFIILLVIWLRRRGTSLGGRSDMSLALLLAPVSVYSWLALSAFGSPLDILLNGLAALLFGIAVALVIKGFLLPTLNETSTGAGWDFSLGGLAIGMLLLIMSVGFGFQGITLLLMLCIPAFGWAVMLLSRIGNEYNWQAIALFISVIAAAPMMLVDPDELMLILNFGSRDVMAWSFQAVGLTIIVGWLFGIVGFVWREQVTGLRPSFGLKAGVAAAWVLGGAAYFLVGQPGFHGDRLFVILKQQANLSEAAQIADPLLRRQYAFETLTSHAEATQGALRESLEQVGVSYEPYYLVNALEVEGGPLHRWWLESRPEVERVLDSPVLRPLPAPAEETIGSKDTPPTTPEWNLTQIRADQVWNELGIKGEGILVGQSDSGVQLDHPEFAQQYRGRNEGHDYNWFDPWNHTSQPVDLGGHGTHTLGSILGKNVGVAPGAEWIGCTNLARNLANPALYLDCMQFMLAPFPLGGDAFQDGDPLRGAHVLNNSWGCPIEEGCDADALLPAVRGLRAAGVFVVASAGNEGPACSTVASPIALYDESFSVGAVDEERELADFSSRGPVTADGSGRIKPDIVAPGVHVLSAYPNSSYEYNGGTSMAGPHIAGVVALIWSANPSLIGEIERTEQILIETTQPATGAPEECGDVTATPNNGVGYGLVDAYAAVERALRE